MTEQSANKHDSAFLVGEWRVEPDTGRLLRDNQEVKLEPKAMDVLVLLARHPGKVVNRETLEQTVWAGTVIGYDAISATIIKLRKAFNDDTRNPNYIETVTKKGYRLIATVNAIETHVPSPIATLTTSSLVDEHNDPQPFDRKISLSKQLFAAKKLIVSIIALAGIVYLMSILNPQRVDTDDIKTPLVLVLPFEYLNPDAGQAYLSDGLTSDLITDLSRLKSLRVIGRHTSNYFKTQKDIKLEDIGNDLGADFVVQGSIQKLDDQFRINVQVTDINKRETIWADRYEAKTNQIFKIQDTITHQVIAAMAGDLKTKMIADGHSVAKAANFAAYDLFLQGQSFASQRSKEGYDQAMAAYQKTIELDPNYARAYSAMAFILTNGYRFDWTELSLVEARERALKMALHAVNLDQSTPQIYWALSYTHLHRREYEAAEQAALKSIELSPSYADGLALLGYISNWRGKFTQAEDYIQRAMELNPYYTFDYPWNLGLSFYGQAKYKQAIESLQNALLRNENALNPRLFLAASYVKQGMLDDAKWEIENIRTTRPNTTLAQLKITLPFENKQTLDELLVVLEKAGLPN